jgi:hypothetical protein
MSRSLLFSVLVLISISFIGCGKSDDDTVRAEPLEKKIIGKWKINVARTVELSKTNPIVKPAEYDKLPESVQRMADWAQMEITATEIKMTMGKETMATAYTVESSDPQAKKMNIMRTSQSEEKVVTVACVLTIIDDVYINIKSTEPNYQNYHVWEPVKETPAE